MRHFMFCVRWPEMFAWIVSELSVQAHGSLIVLASIRPASFRHILSVYEKCCDIVATGLNFSILVVFFIVFSFSHIENKLLNFQLEMVYQRPAITFTMCILVCPVQYCLRPKWDMSRVPGSQKILENQCSTMSNTFYSTVSLTNLKSRNKTRRFNVKRCQPWCLVITILQRMVKDQGHRIRS